MRFAPGRWLVPVAIVATVVLPRASYAATTTIRIADSFSPASVTVAPGSTIVWINDDADRHRVRSYEGPDEFDSGNLESGERYLVVLSVEGVYRYHDDRDRDDTRYRGTITVRAGGGGTTPSGGGEPGSSAPRSASVSMAGRRFTPATVEIAAGGTVAWRNDDDREHTVTARTASFDSGVMGVGARYSRTFRAAGRFSYLCAIHPDMTGTVVVLGSDGKAPAEEPARAPARTAPPATAGEGSGSVSTAPVAVIDFAFDPTSVRVEPGGSVRWTILGQAPHTVTSTDGTFDSGIISPGATFTHTFRAAGVFDYVCSLHPQMTGRVVVAAANEAVPEQGEPSASPAAADGERGVPDDPLAGAEPAGGSPGRTVDDVLLPDRLVAGIIVAPIGFVALALAAIAGRARRRPLRNR